ncbi:alpha/beta hydrolase [Sphaerisporangium album]|uniref:Alpha/beta hydrolase n=1 Tax=Sphaerisporangium album TaxID=509200 RepID=A0A367FP82_9ACTN|nr:alpha/beta hydrolase [Sphaerisporangium album]RCG31490.1 alpha/beta hydrolase [Sphaerisporangium album]
MSDLATRGVTSADGTPVEYLSAGHGPHVIVVPGALAVASDLTAFAGLLANRHTVHVVQRRGRGGSGPQGDRYGIARECEDIEAVRARTGARLIFGHSFGGLVALRAACGNPAFDAVAVYEPGVSVGGSIPVGWIDRARGEISEGADFEAFITFVRGVNPDQTGRVPRWLLRIILRRAISPAEMRQNLALMPQAISEHVEVGRFDGRLTDYREIAADTLIMRGKGRDTGRQAVALAQLAGTIPRSETGTFRTLDHFAPEKKPGEIADAVLRFFAAHARTGVQIGG